MKKTEIKKIIKKAKKWCSDIEKDGLDLGGCPPLTYEEEAYWLIKSFLTILKV
jgi:hypothetical protein